MDLLFWRSEAYFFWDVLTVLCWVQFNGCNWSSQQQELSQLNFCGLGFCQCFQVWNQILWELKTFTSTKEFLLPFECGANKSLYLEGEDQQNNFVMTELIWDQGHFQLGSLPLGWFWAGLGAFPSASRQWHRVVALLSIDRGAGKAKHFSCSQPQPHLCWGRAGKRATVDPVSWRLTGCDGACSREGRGMVSLLAVQFIDCKRKGNSSTAFFFQNLFCGTYLTCNSHPLNCNPGEMQLSLKLYVPVTLCTLSLL